MMRGMHAAELRRAGEYARACWRFAITTEASNEGHRDICLIQLRYGALTRLPRADGGDAGWW